MFTKSFWDRIGIGLSGLYTLHCLLFPVVIVLLPLWPVAELVITTLGSLFWIVGHWINYTKPFSAR